jgi:hypothetical protein
MICNKKMEELLKQIDQNELPIVKALSIWVKKNDIGETLWGVGNFCGCVGKKPTSVHGKKLTDLEWDGNEFNINRWEADKTNIKTSCILRDVVSEALSIVMEWKSQLKKEYAETSFDIVLSVSEGDSDISPSATIRFYAVRDSYNYIYPDANNLEKFSQPILMEQVNY